MEIDEIAETFWAWLAGFIDGDGNFQLHRSKNKLMKRGFSWMPRIIIANNNERVLNYINTIIGFGNVSFLTKRKYKQLRFTSKQARLILPKIIPYLKLKREEAEVLLMACKILAHGQQYGYKGRPQAERDELEGLYESMCWIRKHR